MAAVTASTPSRLRLQPIIDVLADHVFGEAVALLNSAFELIASPVDLREIVVRELTPLLFDFALRFFPASFNPVPVHRRVSKESSALKSGALSQGNVCAIDVRFRVPPDVNLCKVCDLNVRGLAAGVMRERECMERFAMNSKRTVLVTATAALLTAAAVTAASAQTQERGNTRMNAGQNLSTGGQMNAQGPGGQQSQGGNFSRNEGGNLSRNEFQGTTRNKSGMTSNRYSSKYTGRDRDRDHFAYGRDRDRDRFAVGRDRDRDRFAYSGRDRDRFANAGRYRDRDRFAYGGGGGGWNNGWGWGGPGFDVSVGYGGWGSPGYYDPGYDYGYPGLYSYAPGYVGVGFGGGCTCGALSGWR